LDENFMAIKSAGILLFRKKGNALEIFLAHPGGPMWLRKDEGAWSIPKGEYDDTEDPLEAAKREFEEETGQRVSGNFIPLKPIRLKSGKIVNAWAVEGDIDADKIKSNSFEMEWPPRSRKMRSFPEVDKGEWFSVQEAKIKINTGQLPLITELEEVIKAPR
jgi:predicted NUDIX family NTP pyrophosphohydrolase